MSGKSRGPPPLHSPELSTFRQDGPLCPVTVVLTGSQISGGLGWGRDSALLPSSQVVSVLRVLAPTRRTTPWFWASENPRGGWGQGSTLFPSWGAGLQEARRGLWTSSGEFSRGQNPPRHTDSLLPSGPMGASSTRLHAIFPAGHGKSCALMPALWIRKPRLQSRPRARGWCVWL